MSTEKEEKMPSIGIKKEKEEKINYWCKQDLGGLMSDENVVKPVFGIDLGTTNSCISVWLGGKSFTIPISGSKSSGSSGGGGGGAGNDDDDNIIPSCCSFIKSGATENQQQQQQQQQEHQMIVIVGKSAIGHEQSISEAKRIIGQNFTSIQNVLKFLPFTVLKDGALNRSYYQLKNKPDWKIYPEQVSALVLKALKQIAGDFLRNNILDLEDEPQLVDEWMKKPDVVITVPAYFSDGQREATKIAAEMAGFNLVKTISEPVAAAIQYAYCKTTEILKFLNDNNFTEYNMLVYDLGGGTFDTAIISMDTDSAYCVRSTNGNSRLGGAIFVNKLMNHCFDKIKTESNIDCHGKMTKNNLKTFRENCEKAMIGLSVDDEASIEVTGIPDVHKQTMNTIIIVQRSAFEEMIKPYIQKTLQCIDMVVKDTDFYKEKIHQIILIGGCTKIPIIQDELVKHLKTTHEGLIDWNNDIPSIIDQTFNAMESVACGACVQMATLIGKDNSRLLTVRNVVPQTIGVISQDRDPNHQSFYQRYIPLIFKNQRLPTSKIICGTTVENNQPSGMVIIYEGNQHDVIGSAILRGITRGKRKQQRLEIKVAIDRNGNLSVSITDQRNPNIFIDQKIERPKQFTMEEIETMKQFIDQFELIFSCDGINIKEEEEEAEGSVASKRSKFEEMFRRLADNSILIPDDDFVCPVYGSIDDAAVSGDFVIDLTTGNDGNDDDDDDDDEVEGSVVEEEEEEALAAGAEENVDDDLQIIEQMIDTESISSDEDIQMEIRINQHFY